MAGRKPFEPSEKDRVTVKAMIGYGITQDDVAKVIGISDVSLRKYFPREIELAVVEANLMVAQSLHQMATKGKNVTAAIWWSKTRMGWSERLPVDKDGNARAGVTIHLASQPVRPRPLLELISDMVVEHEAEDEVDAHAPVMPDTAE